MQQTRSVSIMMDIDTHTQSIITVHYLAPTRNLIVFGEIHGFLLLHTCRSIIKSRYKIKKDYVSCCICVLEICTIEYVGTNGFFWVEFVSRQVPTYTLASDSDIEFTLIGTYILGITLHIFGLVAMVLRYAEISCSKIDRYF